MPLISAPETSTLALVSVMALVPVATPFEVACAPSTALPPDEPACDPAEEDALAAPSPDVPAEAELDAEAETPLSSALAPASASPEAVVPPSSPELCCRQHRRQRHHQCRHRLKRPRRHLRRRQRSRHHRRRSRPRLHQRPRRHSRRLRRLESESWLASVRCYLEPGTPPDWSTCRIPRPTHPLHPNSLQRVVSFRMIYSFVDQEAPGQQTARPFERCSGGCEFLGDRCKKAAIYNGFFNI